MWILEHHASESQRHFCRCGWGIHSSHERLGREGQNDEHAWLPYVTGRHPWTTMNRFMIGAWICTAPAARAAVDSSAATTAKGQDWETTECAHVNQTFIFTLIAVSQ
ncbi:Os02g0771750 [Oryza sativa Japonica Group]|uniref:Os02g0771750 protein n=1 Tax=Oryza sativa subsp. japonica TaxID=39947 RepID=A0A0P0VQ93_ORYSJ|nr:Os02g0771750 [Oryza sativa Japonica Group]